MAAATPINLLGNPLHVARAPDPPNEPPPPRPHPTASLPNPSPLTPPATPLLSQLIRDPFRPPFASPSRPQILPGPIPRLDHFTRTSDLTGPASQGPALAETPPPEAHADPHPHPAASLTEARLAWGVLHKLS